LVVTSIWKEEGFYTSCRNSIEKVILTNAAQIKVGEKRMAAEMETWMLIAFDSTQQALRAEMLLEYAEVEIDLFPTPKEITAGCALSIQFPPDQLDSVQTIIQQEQVEIRGIYFKDSIEGYKSIEDRR
jgi:hypothetical protein